MLSEKPESAIRKELRRLFSKGLPTRVVAEIVDRDHAHVASIRREMGMAMPCGRVPSPQRLRACALYKAGFTLSEIYESTGYSRGATLKAIRKIGIPVQNVYVPWPAHQVSHAKRLYYRGYSHRQIAAIMSKRYGIKRTKNSIAGLIWRNGWERGTFGGRVTVQP